MFGSDRKGSQRSINIWPGFVDALATLLLVVIFVLMVFMVAQFYLSTALTGRDAALERLNKQVAELAELLALERAASFRLQGEVDKFSTELQSSLIARESLSDQLSGLNEEREELRNQLAQLTEARDDLSTQLDKATSATSQVNAELEDAYKTIDADKEKIQAQLAEIAILKSLRDELRAELAASNGKVIAAEKLTEEAELQVALLNRQVLALRQQLAQLSEALDLAEIRNKEQEVQIADLGKRLNVALAGKVQELARYRSEFFGRLRKVLGERPDIRVVGDRFVFQSEILFESASADLGPQGQVQMRRLAQTLLQIAAEIPDELDWVLRVDGHTDRRPISTSEFPSNWELSTARAISVVRFLIAEGVPAKRLAATGFGEFQPIESGLDEIALRRNRRIELKLTQR